MLNRSKLISTSNNTTSNSNATNNVALTLPITCQICLSRVKDPCVCSNLHAFCKFCIEIWLEKSKQCPTCRIDISQENPCKRILGGIEHVDEINEHIKPNDFSNASMRKARFLNIFHQYEDEISRLCKYIDTLNIEISNYKEAKSTSTPKHDILQMVKNKLQQTQNSLDEALLERDKLKEANKKLENENTTLNQDLIRLKVNLTEMNSQLANRPNVSLIETKLQTYEKEIKYLQSALDRSDKYIAELETKQLINSPTPSTTSSASTNSKRSSDSSSNKLNTLNDSKSTLNSDKSTNSLAAKNVKFSDKIDTIHLNDKNINQKEETLNFNSASASLQVPLTSQSSNHVPASSGTTTKLNQPFGSSSVNSFNINKKRDNFYGLTSTNKFLPNSPSKLNPKSKTLEFEMPSPLSQSISEEKNLFNDKANLSIINKRVDLNRSDYYFEKPSINGEETLNATANDLNESLKSPTKSILCKETKKINSEESSSKSSPIKTNSFDTLMFNSTSEFKDCLKLLNQAEKKVQNRISSPTKSQISEKYFLTSQNKNNMQDEALISSSNICHHNHHVNNSSGMFSSSFYSNHSPPPATPLDINFGNTVQNNDSIKSHMRLFSLPNRIRKYSSIEKI